jgi:hypothetical protein
MAAIAASASAQTPRYAQRDGQGPACHHGQEDPSRQDVAAPPDRDHFASGGHDRRAVHLHPRWCRGGARRPDRFRSPRRDLSGARSQHAGTP